MPATHTVSPYFVLGLGVALTVIRNRRVCQSWLDVTDLELSTVSPGYRRCQQRTMAERRLSFEAQEADPVSHGHLVQLFHRAIDVSKVRSVLTRK